MSALVATPPNGGAGQEVMAPEDAKASRNRVTALKLLAEQSARERNSVKIQEAIDRIIDLALVGDATAMSLVWKSVMSNGAADTATAAAEKVSININTAPQVIPAPEPTPVEGEVVRHVTVAPKAPVPELRSIIGEVIVNAPSVEKEKVE